MVQVLSIFVDPRRRLLESSLALPQPVIVEYALVLPPAIDASYVTREGRAVSLPKITQALAVAAGTSAYFAVVRHFELESEASDEASEQEQQEVPIASLAVGFGTLCVCIPLMCVAAKVFGTGKFGLFSTKQTKVHALQADLQSVGRAQFEVHHALQQPSLVNPDEGIVRLEAGTSTTDLVAVEQICLPALPGALGTPDMTDDTPRTLAQSALEQGTLPALPALSVTPVPSAWRDADEQTTASPRMHSARRAPGLPPSQASPRMPSSRASPATMNSARRAAGLPTAKLTLEQLELAAKLKQQLNQPPQELPRQAWGNATLLTAPRAVQPPAKRHSPSPKKVQREPASINQSSYRHNSNSTRVLPEPAASNQSCRGSTPPGETQLRVLAQACVPMGPPPITSWRQQQGIKWDTDHAAIVGQIDLPDPRKTALEQQLRAVGDSLAMTMASAASDSTSSVPGIRKVELTQRLVHLKQTQRELQQQLREVSNATAVVKAEQRRIKVQPPPPRGTPPPLTQKRDRRRPMSQGSRPVSVDRPISYFSVGR